VPQFLKDDYEFGIFVYDEDGLRKMEAVVIDIDGTLYWLRHPEGQDPIKTIVEVLSYEPNLDIALEKLVSQFSVSKTELPWVAEKLGKAKWSLSKLDGNGNEIEMYRFHDAQRAKLVQEYYEEKGHKQIYFVKNAI